MKYLKEIKQFIGANGVKYDTWGGGYIWGTDEKSGSQMIAQVTDVDEIMDDVKNDTPIVSVRGWGAIQHLFPTSKEQIEFQDELGIFIQDAINEKLNK
jgi:hypothetical protein